MTKKIISFLLVCFIAITLTGCGSGENKGDSRFDYIIEQMNTASSESLERQGNVSVSTMENRFTQNLSSARIIACGDKEFTKDVDLTQTSYTNNLDGYKGLIATFYENLTKDSNVNYCLVYATNARGYLNVTVKYEKAKDTYKPVFSIPELLNK